MKNIGIIGSGMVGKALGDGFIKYGNKVMIGSRDTEKLRDWDNEHRDDGKTGSFDEAAQFGDVLVLAVKGSAAENALDMIGKDNLRGKTIIDATNPISDEGPEEGVLKYFTDLNSSLMEKLQEKYPDAHFVKAFNSIGSAFMVDPEFESKPTMFICGNDENAKKEVSSVLDQFGWETEDMGSATAARAIEPLAILWCIPGFKENQWAHAFKLLKK